jgi:tetratricopeptide (TPR) repeat protein
MAYPKILLVLFLVLAGGSVLPAVAIPADDEEQLFQRGVSAVESMRAEEAEEIFTRLIARDAQSRYFFYRGVAYRSQDKLGHALQDFNRALSMEPDNGDYYLQRGFTLLLNAQFREALEDLTRALEIDPSSADAWAHRAHALMNLSEHRAALEDLNQALQLRPDYPELFKLRGDVLSALGHYEAAVEAYDTALRLKPQDAAALNNRGVALLNLGKRREGRDDMLMALEIATSIPSPPKLDIFSGSPW